jgi:hypothetical protein
MIDIDKEVQGTVLYTEFRKPGAMVQMFITPQGHTLNGVLVNSRFYRRTITTYSPKKQWKFNTFYPYSDEMVAEVLEGNSIDSQEGKDNYLASRLQKYENIFHQLKDGEWNAQKPFFVEISKKDYTDIYLDKTPTKVIYRINQTRDALGFPSDLD